MPDNQPLEPVENGRDGLGRFGRGNKFALGRGPSEAARIRRLIRASVSDDDVRSIVGVLVAEAKAGNLAAIREVLDRLIGRPRPADDEADGRVVVVEFEGGPVWSKRVARDGDE